MKTIKKLAIAITALALMPSMAQADIIWDWSFANTSGQFITDGDDPTNPGIFTLIDFSVTASDVATLGSLSGGEYASDGFATTQPYAVHWDGNAVTLWDSAGNNSFDWWVFRDLMAAVESYIFFGWETGNINTVDQASYYNPPCCDAPSFLLTVTPASVPEPGTLLLFGLGLLGFGAARRKLS